MTKIKKVSADMNSLTSSLSRDIIYAGENYGIISRLSHSY